MKIVAVSDLHIYSDNQFGMVDDLYMNDDIYDCDILILDGDIGDSWEAKWKEIVTTFAWQRLKHIVGSRHHRGLRTIWIKGNHDRDAKKRYLPGADIMSSYQYQDVVFIHGWQFDWSWNILHPVAFWISRKWPTMTVRLHNLLRPKRNMPSYEKRTHRERWNEHSGLIQLRAMAYAKKHKKHVVIGHTHCRMQNDLISDCGEPSDRSPVIIEL